MNNILHKTKIMRQWSYRYISGNSVIYHPPSLKNIPTKWNQLSIPLKEEIQEYLDWQMTGDWRDMSANEKQSIYYISYGSWGPRGNQILNIKRIFTNFGNNNNGTQVNISYLVIRGLFNLALVSAVGVSILNLKKDKQLKDKEQIVI
ncbi:hypothetical protein RI543_001173 [Arxiozyma heterogenica]|uniref:Uncharacterized protein n=1 Tax=Arxiozyma heterogenica TaxID=278026 RepID=A0AAN7WQ77_9SACH|nr:hypothetical protein RI543_001173 [Kazachstania heterogenica]